MEVGTWPGVFDGIIATPGLITLPYWRLWDTPTRIAARGPLASAMGINCRPSTGGLNWGTCSKVPECAYTHLHLLWLRR